MADNKTKPTDLNVQAFLNACPDEIRRADAKALAELMQKVNGKEPAMWGPSIVGFDSRHYKYASGREGDMPIVGFSPRKAANVLYGTLGVEGADTLLARLGRHTTGKGCLYIKKLADVDMKVLETLLRNAVAAKREQLSGTILAMSRSPHRHCRVAQAFRVPHSSKPHRLPSTPQMTRTAFHGIYVARRTAAQTEFDQCIGLKSKVKTFTPGIETT